MGRNKVEHGSGSVKVLCETQNLTSNSILHKDSLREIPQQPEKRRLSG